MRIVVNRAAQFAIIAFCLILLADALLSLVFQPPPPSEHRATFLLSHGVFHGAVLCLSAIGAFVGFTIVRKYLPSTRAGIGLACAYSVVTLLAGPGAFMLAGASGAATWLLLGSTSFAVGAAVFAKPWRVSREA